LTCLVGPKGDWALVSLKPKPNQKTPGPQLFNGWGPLTREWGPKADWERDGLKRRGVSGAEKQKVLVSRRGEGLG